MGFIYNTAAREMWRGAGGTALDLGAATKLKIGLASSSYVANRDDDVADAAGANDFIDHEVSGTGYTAGYGGSGRKTLASKTYTLNKASDRTEFDAADVVWSSIDAGSADQAVAFVEDHLGAAGNDTETRLVAQDATNFPVTFNGGDFTLQIADLIRLSTA